MRREFSSLNFSLFIPIFLYLYHPLESKRTRIRTGSFHEAPPCRCIFRSTSCPLHDFSIKSQQVSSKTRVFPSTYGEMPLVSLAAVRPTSRTQRRPTRPRRPRSTASRRWRAAAPRRAAPWASGRFHRHGMAVAGGAVVRAYVRRSPLSCSSWLARSESVVHRWWEI